jgi:uncharacterized protein (DUF697 family)
MAKEPTGSGTPEKKDPVAARKPTDSESGQIEMTPEERTAQATKLVERYSLWSGAGGLIPLPVIDVVVVGGIQLDMLRRLAALYNVPFREDLGKSVLASLVGSLIPASSGMGVASALKSVPVVGTGVGILTMSGVSAGATYLIGRVFMQHFSTGGTLLDFNPPDYHEFIKSTKEKLSWSRTGESSADSSSSSRPAQGKAPAST